MENNNLTCENAAKYFGMSKRTYYSFENITYILTKNKILKATNEGAN